MKRLSYLVLLSLVTIMFFSGCTTIQSHNGVTITPTLTQTPISLQSVTSLQTPTRTPIPIPTFIRGPTEQISSNEAEEVANYVLKNEIKNLPSVDSYFKTQTDRNVKLHSEASYPVVNWDVDLYEISVFDESGNLVGFIYVDKNQPVSLGSTKYYQMRNISLSLEEENKITNITVAGVIITMISTEIETTLLNWSVSTTDLQVKR